MTKDEYFKLYTAVVQEQVWVIASSFVMLLEAPPPRYGWCHVLETELVYTEFPLYNTHEKEQEIFNLLYLFFDQMTKRISSKYTKYMREQL